MPDAANPHAPTRVWAIGRWEWEYESDGRPLGRTDVLPYQGFFLLEADAFAHADYLNKDFMEQYITEAKRRAATGFQQSFEQWAGANNYGIHEPVEIPLGALRADEGVTR